MFARTGCVLLLLLGSFMPVEAETGFGLEGLVKYSMPNFPTGLRGVMSGDGEVVVALTIGLDGGVKDSVALLATNSDFARAALRAVNNWEFYPVEAQTWPRREIVEFSFRRSGVVTSLSHAEAARDGFKSKAYHQIKTVQIHELDREPGQLAGIMPTVSSSVLDSLDSESVFINFVIDTDGKVRVPVVMNTMNPQVADAVLEAVATWRYSPPVHDGKAVLAEVTRVFVFEGTGF